MSPFRRLCHHLFAPVWLGVALGIFESALVLVSFSQNLNPGQKVFAAVFPGTLYGLVFWFGAILLETVGGRLIGPLGGRRRTLLNWAWLLGTALLAVLILRFRLYNGLSQSLMRAMLPMGAGAVTRKKRSKAGASSSS